MSNYIPVKGYEEYYLVSPDGSVLSTYYGIELKHGEAAGYPKVTLYKPGRRPKTHHIHRLLAEHFIPNPDGLPQVNHKNGNPRDFRLENLEWCSVADNIRHAYRELGKKSWNNGLQFVDRRRNCENCSHEFKYKRKSTRFCSTSCSAKWRVKKYPHTVARERHPETGRLLRDPTI